MIPRLLLGCVMGLALVTFAPGANAQMHPLSKEEKKEEKKEERKETLRILHRECKEGREERCDDRIEDDDEVSRRRRHR
jgi:hypothetical protein